VGSLPIPGTPAGEPAASGMDGHFRAFRQSPDRIVENAGAETALCSAKGDGRDQRDSR